MDDEAGIDHVAVLVRSVDRAAEVLARRGVGAIGERDTFPSEGTAEVYVGEPGRGARLLLLEAIGPGPYRRALEARGPGLHHLALVASDAVVARGLAAGWRLVRSGAVRWLGRSGLPLVEVLPRGASASPLVTAVSHPLPAGAEALLTALGLEGIVTTATAGEARLVLEGRTLALAELGGGPLRA